VGALGARRYGSLALSGLPSGTDRRALNGAITIKPGQRQQTTITAAARRCSWCAALLTDDRMKRDNVGLQHLNKGRKWRRGMAALSVNKQWLGVARGGAASDGGGE